MMHTVRSLRKPSLLAGCALGALLLALPEKAAAQRAFEGAPTVVAGTATITTAPNYTLVVPTSPQVVINWEPLDNVGLGTINFLPAGTLAEFAEVTGTFDFTVLNRILPVDPAKNPVNRVVQFNGTVFSRVGNFPGGDIWFYSPTGIIAGPTAVFNVGSLILTTNDIPFVAGSPTGIYGPGGLVQLQGPAGSTGFVDVQAGAQITASAGPFGPAYVALVAPRVVQAGQVSANGQIAYIAAEQLDMTINGGLFDFVLTMGTTDTEGVVHTGTTTGPASTSAADVQRISMVALPKNDAMTMLLSGSIGYTPAASAANEGSSVVLAAGFATDDPTVVPANRLGSIAIGTTTFRNALTGYATDAIDVAPGVTTAFGGATTLHAVNAIDLTSTISTSITAASTLTLRAGQPGTGGTIDLNALGGGQITAAGGFALNAGSGAANYDSVTPFVDALGGTVNILADGGTITTPLDFVTDVGAIAGDDPALGGQGSGGTINLQLDNGGIVGASTMTLTALGRGGGSNDTGGNGLGGTIAVVETAGQLNLGSLSLFAQSAGGDAVVRAGDGAAGTVSIDLLGQAQDIDNLYLDASASAGLPTDPAGASGHASSAPDSVRLTVAGPASLTVQFGIELNADARTGIEVIPGLGGQAGGVLLEAIGGGSIDAGSLDLHANTLLRGDSPDVVPAHSPTQLGGLVSVLADTGGTIVTDALSAVATAAGHEATVSAGIATGGTAEVLARNGGTITVDDGLGTALLTVVADGLGAAGPIAADAFGGTARLVAEDGSITVGGAIELSASAVMADSPAATAGDGFDATGGIAGVELLSGALGTASISTGTLAVRANGDARLFFGPPSPGGDPAQGDGGDGAGGTASLLLEAGTLTSTTLLLESTGTGGASAGIDAASPFVSGDGTGGTSRLVLDGGTATVTTLDLQSLGQGGGGAPDATAGQLAAFAGAGTGGNAFLEINGGSLTTTDAGLRAIGTGAAGMGHAGGGAATDGGDGTGGTAAFQSPPGGAGSFTTGSLSLLASGVGGNGGVSATGTSGNGGDGTGFVATADLADGMFSLGGVVIGATGTGGGGDNGGVGTGGLARFALIDSLAGPVGPRSIASLSVDSSGSGGIGLGGVPAANEDGELIFTANVRDAAAALDIAGDLSLFNTGGPVGAGTGIDVLIAGAPLTVGGRIQMSASEDLNIDVLTLLRAGLDVGIGGNAVRSTGLIQSDGAMFIAGSSGVDAADLTAGTWLYVQSFLGAALGNLTAGTDAAASAFDGDLTVGTVTAGDEIWLSVFGTDPTHVLTAGNLVSTGLGDDTADGPPPVFGGPGPTGNVTRVRSSGSLVLGDVQTPGRAILVADNGTIDAGVLAGPEGVILLGRGDIALAGATTTGKFYVADSALFLPNLPDAYDPASLDGVTPVDTGGSLTVTGPIDAGTVSITVGGSATLVDATSGGTTLLRATGGTASVDNLRSTGLVTASGQAVDIASTGALTFADLDATAGDLSVITAGSLALATADATGAATLRSTGGALTASGPINAGGTSWLEGSTGVTLPFLRSGGSPLIEAPNGQIEIAELLTFGGITARGRGIDIASTGALFFPEATATAGDVSLLAAGELVTGLVSASGLVDLRTTNDYMRATGNVTGGTILMTAFDRIEAGANLVSASTLTVDAGGSFILAGSARGTSVSVLSSDIAMGAAASIGLRGLTQDLTLANRNPATTMFIGSGAEPSGYSLEQAEAARLFADSSISLGSAGDVAVRDLALTFAATGNIGTGGQLEISTPAEIAITGDVALTTSGADDTLLIDPTRVELDSTTGSIALLNAGGTPLGRLSIVGDTIAIASTNALTQLRTATDMAAINALLDAPGGAGQPLRAGTITVDANDAFFVQNSGASAAFADRRGFAAGGLEITTASAATRIAINGQILTAGGPVSGLDTAPLIRINGAAPAAGGQFNPASTINGCVIGGNCAFVPPPPDPPDLDLPTSEDIESPIPPGDGAGSLFVAPLIELAATEPLIAPPLVDEPITGVGNDDLWEPRCEPGDEDSPCPEEDGQP